MKGKVSYVIYLLILTICTTAPSFAQTGEQKVLEAKRERLQEEIKEINRLLFAERKEKGTVLDQMEALDNKINV
jgi:hypothetical protein